MISTKSNRDWKKETLTTAPVTYKEICFPSDLSVTETNMPQSYFWIDSCLIHKSIGFVDEKKYIMRGL